MGINETGQQRAAAQVVRLRTRAGQVAQIITHRQDAIAGQRDGAGGWTLRILRVDAGIGQEHGWVHNWVHGSSPFQPPGFTRRRWLR
ncbi:hypothetical protein [Candidatus Amarobacter glycogenicus]|uniref:hypothetical protein n=1 Tax=Candidatus Amarobacter glycogenicus TaxID=3140699 RepID=UPI002A0BD7C0|nr:hypothetical protein [Dehalococcoidia bacterium]